LRCDIGWRERERIYGERWHRFLASCRATLGTESGASIADFDGSVEAQVREYLIRHPQATFEEVERDVLAPYEGNVVINVVSPRVFEAAALRTGMVLFPGEYSGIVEPWTHYIPLQKDFSNMDEVVAHVRDQAFLEAMVARAHADLVASGSYSLRRFVTTFDDLVVAHSTPSGRTSKRSYSRALLRNRLSSPRRSRLRAPVGRLLWPLAAGILVARDSTARRLLSIWLGDSGLRRSLRVRRLLSDLWRIAALRRSWAEGAGFHVESVVDPPRHMLLSARASLSSRAPGDGLAALAGGELAEIVWDHSRVGENVPLFGGSFLSVPLGHHGVIGAHSFSALVELSRRSPQALLDVFGPFLTRRGNGS
jgi:hypothetical protein